MPLRHFLSILMPFRCRHATPPILFYFRAAAAAEFSPLPSPCRDMRRDDAAARARDYARVRAARAGALKLAHARRRVDAQHMREYGAADAPKRATAHYRLID